MSEISSLETRHRAELATEHDKLMLCQQSADNIARERDQLQETLQRLRDELSQQTQQLQVPKRTPRPDPHSAP